MWKRKEKRLTHLHRVDEWHAWCVVVCLAFAKAVTHQPTSFQINFHRQHHQSSVSTIERMVNFSARDHVLIAPHCTHQLLRQEQQVSLVAWKEVRPDPSQLFWGEKYVHQSRLEAPCNEIEVLTSYWHVQDPRTPFYKSSSCVPSRLNTLTHSTPAAYSITFTIKLIRSTSTVWHPTRY